MYLPFVEAFFEVLPNFGFTEIKRGDLSLKDKLVAGMDVTALIGLSKDLRGNVAYGMDQTTAQNIASMMMMGTPVEELDGMAQSAIAEMANILASNAVIALEREGLSVNISPPALITGDKVVVVSRVKTLAIFIRTEAGPIEANIGLEML
jgi:chemotaxis protein CheX